MSINPQEFFDSLTRNAIDFLKKSVGELDNSPKYSVIHFCSAIELFLKARLLVEHWSLIITKPENANLSKFKAGDFHSVSMQEAINRLKNISGEKIVNKAKTNFEIVRNHRNKLIHFFHEKYIVKSDDTILEEVVPEQFAAWYYLHSLLTIKWKSVFKDYLDEIEALNLLMHRHRDYLNAKYEELKREIEKEKCNGIQYKSCYFCSFDAAKVDDSDDPLFSCTCRVCNMHFNFLVVPCRDCNTDIQVEDLGHGECEKCGFVSDLDFILDKLCPYEDPKEDPVRAYCGYCLFIGPPTAIPFNSEYLCLCCLELADAPENCEWCNELVAGMDMDGSYLSGCVLGDGMKL